MSVDIATLGISVDTTQVKAATADLDKLTVSGTRVTGVQETTARATAQMAQAMQLAQASAGPLATVTAEVEKYTLAEAIAADKLVESLKQQAAMLGMTKTEMMAYKAAQLGVTGETAGYIKSIEAAAGSAHSFSLANAGVTRELGVMGGEIARGNFARLEGSMIVMANRMNLMPMLFSSTGAAIVGVGAAAISVGAAFVQGAADTDRFNTAIRMTGNYAGVTEAQFRTTMRTIADSTNSGMGDARAAMEGMTSSGRMTSETMAVVGQTILTVAKATNQSAEDVTKDYLKMADGVVKFVDEHEKQQHILTTAQYQHIRNLEEEGKAQEAMQAYGAIVDNALQSNADHVWTLKTALESGKKAWSDFWDSAKGTAGSVVNGLSLKGQEDSLRSQMEDHNAGRGTQGLSTDEIKAQGAQLLAAFDDVHKRRMDAEAKAMQEAQDARDHANGLQATKDIADIHKRYESRAVAEAAEIKKYHADIEKQMKDGGEIDSDAEQARIEAEIHKRYAGQTKTPRATDNLQAKQDMAEMQASMDMAKQMTNEKSRMLDLDHKYNLISDKAYYDAKRQMEQDYDALVLADMQKQIDVLSSKKIRDDADRIATQTQINAIRSKMALEAEAAAAKGREYDAEQKLLVPQREFNKLAQEAADLKKQEGLAVGLVQEQVKSYQITAIDGQAQIVSLTQDYADKLKDVGMRMEVIASANPFDAKMATKLEQLNAEADKASAKTGGQKDPYFAMHESLQKYTEAAKQDGAQIGTAMDSAFKGAEDAFVSFTTTGKLSFSSMAQSILADLERIMIKKAIAGLVDMAMGGSGVGMTGGDSSVSSLGSIGMSGGRAGGGSVDANSSYRVNEQGPELLTVGDKDYLMTGAQGGSISPAGSGIGGGDNIQIIVNAQTGETKTQGGGKDNNDAANAAKLGQLIGAKVREVIIQEKRNNGLLAGK